MKNALDKRWDRQLERVRAFVEEHGRLPYYSVKRKDEFPIAVWINNQKKKAKQGLLTDEHIKMLRDVGIPI